MLNINPLGGNQYYYYGIPNSNIELYYASTNESEPPFVKEDDYFIMVCINNNTGYCRYRTYYLISLLEAKYVHNSDAIPVDDRELVIKAIQDTYKSGIEAINNDRRTTIIDTNNPIPDYGILMTANKYTNISDKYLDKMFKRISSAMMMNSIIDSRNNFYWRIVQDYPDAEIIIMFGYIDAGERVYSVKDDFYIMVWITDSDYNINCYRISLTEPKYVYGSSPLPDDCRSVVIKNIRSMYKDGIKAINSSIGIKLFDVKTKPPEYKLL